MSYEDIEVEERGPVGWITINRESRLNALRMTLSDREIIDALAAFERRKDIRAIVVTGSGRKAFCTGWDMEAIDEVSLTELEDIVRGNTRLFDAVWRQRQPVVAAVNGYAVATGAALAMACDLVVVSENAKLAEPEIRHGALSPFLIMPFLTHARAVHEFYMLGDPIDAKQMLQLGLVNEVAPAADLAETAQKLGERIALVPREAMDLKKRSLKAAYDQMGLRAATERHSLSDTLMIGAELPWQKALKAKLEKEGMSAFLEARDGPFKKQR